MSLSVRFLCVALMALAISTASAQGSTRTPLPMDELQTLAAAYEVLKDKHVDSLPGDKILLAAIKGMLREADPDGGEYMTEQEVQAARSGSPGASIGVEVVRRGHQTLLLPLPAAPALAAGVRAGDLLLTVDGKPLRGLSSFDVLALLRGPAGSRVLLGVLRDGVPQPVEIAVERQTLERRDVHVSRPAPDLLALRVHQFGERLLEDVARELEREWRQAPFKGVVLDLRNCPGGLLDASFGLAAVFLPRDAVVAKMLGRTPATNLVFRATPADYTRRGPDPLKNLPAALRALPLVVLVNEGTAAGSEIVAAALKDHGRGFVVGRNTFGRGSVQSNILLNGGRGAVKVTVAYWESPKGARIHGVGVQPDLVLAGAENLVDGEADLAAASAALRKRLPS